MQVPGGSDADGVKMLGEVDIKPDPENAVQINGSIVNGHDEKQFRYIYYIYSTSLRQI